MKTIAELKKHFADINKLKNKASMNTCQFCSELTDSDANDYLEFHFSLLEQQKRYFQSDLKLYFGFRQDKKKAHFFLKNKLQNLTDEKLINDVNEILDDINYSDLEDLKTWMNDLQTGIRSDKDRFVYSIMKSPYVDYHYELIKNPNLDEGFRRHLKSRFEDHKERGELLLLSKLEMNFDIDFHPEIIFILGCINGKHKSESLMYARQFAESEDDYTRDRALIVLGWIGGINECEILEKHLINDNNTECRAWSAASFMQMWFNRKSKSLKNKAFTAFQKALPIETDYFVISVILSTIREISENKLGISQIALDALDKEKIDLAKMKALKYLEKSLKN